MAPVDIVFPVRNEGPLLAATLRSLAVTPAGAEFTVTVVDDGSAPAADCGGGFGLPLRLLRGTPVGAAAARNVGARVGGAPVVCFCDAHLEFTAGWLGQLVEALDAFDGVCPGIASVGRPEACGYGFTWNARYEVRWLPAPGGPAEVPFLPGGCLCLRRAAFAAVGGFDGGLVPWGHEDAELSFALWAAGFRLGVQPRARILHHFRARHPYLVRQDHVDRNLLRLGCVHFGPDRLRRLLAHLRPDAGTLQGVRHAAEGRRRALAARRRRGDDWLCARFRLPL